MAADPEYGRKEYVLNLSLPVYAEPDEIEQEVELVKLAALSARRDFPPDYPSVASVSYTPTFESRPGTARRHGDTPGQS